MIVVGIILVVLIVGGTAVYFLDVPGSQSSQTGFQVTLDQSKLLTANNMQIVLNITLGLHNPTQQDVTFDGALYSLSANGNPLYSGYLNQKTVVKADSSTELSSTISINLSDNPAFSNIGTSFSWRMTGNADITTASGGSKVPFDFNFKTG